MTGLRAGCLAGALWLSTCCSSATPEDQVLTRFFEASRALDGTLLYRLATATFNPRTDGSVQTFAVSNRGAELRAPLSEEHREEARRSLTAGTGQDVDLAGLSVEMITIEMTLDAEVRTPDGAVAPATFVVTLNRAVAKRAEVTLEGRWIVTRLQRARASRTSPAESSAPRS